MALYIPQSILHLARSLYVRPETYGPTYVPPVEIPALNLQQTTTVTKWEAKRTSDVPIILLYILEEEGEGA